MQPHTRSQPLVRVLSCIDQMPTRRKNNEDLLGNRLEVGTKVRRTFQDKNLLLLWLYSEVAKRRLIVCLHAFAAHYNAYPLNSQQRHGAQIYVAPPCDRSGRPHAAVADARDAKCSGIRRYAIRPPFSA